MTMPEAMSHAHRALTPSPSTRGLTIALSALVALGVLGTGASVYTARATTNLIQTRTEFDRSQDMLEDREAEHEALCATLTAMAVKVAAEVPSCMAARP